MKRSNPGSAVELLLIVLGCHDHAWLWCLFGFWVLGGVEQVFQAESGSAHALAPAFHLRLSRRLHKDLQEQAVFARLFSLL